MDMAMSSATPTRVQVVTRVQRRRRWTPAQKLDIVKQTNEPVVPASELQEGMRRIQQLEGALGRKTLANEMLKEAVDFAKAKKWIARLSVWPGGEP